MRALGVALLLLVMTAAPSGQAPARAAFVEGEVLVKFKPGTDDTRRDMALARVSGNRIKRFRELNIDHVQLPAGRNADDVISELLATGDVSAAQPNYVRSISYPSPPNDPAWVDDATYDFYGIKKIGADLVWNTYNNKGSLSVIVADIDTGVRYDHVDLAANMWINPGEIAGNGVDDDGNGYVDDVRGIDTVNHDSNPMDDNGHGTHTAGTIGAVGNNGTGVVGVNWNVTILPCKFLNSQGNGSDAGAIECFNYITMMKNRGFNIRVSNNSWGSYRDPFAPFPQLLKDAIDAAGNAGILNVFAAGNGGADGIGDNIDITPHDPASFTSPSIISVAASDQVDAQAGFSNYGGVSVDVAAPGVHIFSTYINVQNCRPNCWAWLSGTSMATPHVAGAAALLAAQSGTVSVPLMKSLLISNVTPVPAWAGQVASGGRLDVFAAATALNAYNAAVTQAVTGGGTRLQQLQNADGGWYFSSLDTSCGAGAGVSCNNIIGVNGLGLLSAYERGHDPSVLSDAVAAGQLMIALHNANPSQPPFSQDLEFLAALSAATGDPQYGALATAWFTTITSAFPVPADRADFSFNRRNAQGLRTLAVWDLASLIRAAKAAGNVPYAAGVANRIIAREADWKDVTPTHRWDQCASPEGCGPADNRRAFDHTLLGMGSMLWAIHDLTGFTPKVAEYRSWLVSQQDAAGSWDAGDLQITSYALMGLGAVGGSGAAEAVQKAVDFLIASRLPNGGWPFFASSSSEFTNVDSEVTRAVGALANTQAGQSILVAPGQLTTVTFSNVVGDGATTVVAAETSATVPLGYELLPGLTYRIGTTAAFEGAATVCFSTALTTGIGNVRVLHNERGVFVDRTSTTNCTTVDALDTFALATVDSSCKAMPPHAPMRYNCRKKAHERR